MTVRHCAIIMDGNGRWAQALGKDRSYGHFCGAENMKRIALAAQDMGISFLTLYAFSSENWSRPKKEVDYLMKLPSIFFDRFFNEFMEKGIRIRLVGQKDRIYPKTLALFERVEALTAKNQGMVLSLAINYGSQQEIVLAARRYAEEVALGRPNDLDINSFDQYLLTSFLPPVDLCIRTSGEVRLSNFLLWQLAYAELIFVDKPWPSFKTEDLQACLDTFAKRTRRYGGLKECGNES